MSIMDSGLQQQMDDEMRKAREEMAQYILNGPTPEQQAKLEAARAAIVYEARQAKGQVVGLDASLPPGVRGVCSERTNVAAGIPTGARAQSRSFTRDEVLLVLKAIKADTGVVAGREALDKAVRVFEKLE